ncbi:hypothetical protein QJQ45_001045 [Haematococcus lacustris]|nr:hypothetical protein QJQ45_001045 [Haematococcus lacustris]
MAESYHSVVVVGAGISGLYAAHLLKAQFPDLLVVEAQDSIGGRIKQLHDLAPWPIEAGPEFVHGRHSILVHVTQQMGVQFREKEWPEWWYFKQDKQLLRNNEVDAEVRKVSALMEETVGGEALPPVGNDVSARDWLLSKGATPKMLAVADAGWANDFGGSLHRVGLREMIEENKRWVDGESYLQMDRSMGEVAKALAQGVCVRTSCPVNLISYSPQGTDGNSSSSVTLHCADNRRIRCRAVIITASLRILQDGVLQFSPPLPERKQQAISRIRMGNVVKIILTFSKRFWPEDQYDVLCPDCFVPEYWMLRYPAKNMDPSLGQHSVVGFVAGDRADALSLLPQDQVVSRFLAQLDEVYGAASGTQPATTHLVAARVVDWSQEPWVRGAYTYPTLGAEQGDREELAAPVASCLFFAGEACNVELNPCLQGAMESAQRAAIALALQIQPASYQVAKL